MYHINSCKHKIVHGLENSTFAAIKSTGNKSTTALTPKTVGYIHALVIDAIIFHSTQPQAPYACALINEEIVYRELDKSTPAAFRTELRDCLADYYEKVCTREGAGGIPQGKTHKRKFKAFAPAAAAEYNMDGASLQHVRRPGVD